MRRKRKVLPSIADLTESSTGPKNVERTVSNTAASACPPPAAMKAIVPAVNHAARCGHVTPATSPLQQHRRPFTQRTQMGR
jgi:hypothetical protein